MNEYKGFLFDLDGVLVDTAKYHFLAWKSLAKELGINFTEQDNERLKGVSRMKSFEIILEIGNITMDEPTKEKLCNKKNQLYVSYIQKLRQDEILPGVRDFLTQAKKERFKTALGSASKNSRLILERLQISDLLDVIVDGTLVTHAKPNPEVFLKGAQLLHVLPQECIVFEDAVAGIEAAHQGGMPAVGVGSKELLPQADLHINGFSSITPKQLIEKLSTIKLSS